MKTKKLDKYSQLVKLGLSNHQALVYCALLEQGDSTVLKLSTATKLNRITVHKVIDELVSLGLVFNTVSGKRRILSAAPPEALQNLIINQEKELAEKKEMTGDLINSLYQTINKIKDRTDSEVKFYEGYKAVSQLYDEMILSGEIKAIINAKEIYKYFPENPNKFIKALNNGLVLWDLALSSDDKDEYRQWELNFVKYKAKFLPASFIDFGAIDYSLYDGNIVMIEGGRIPKAMKIRNESFYQLSLHLYSLLWKVAETK